jgi:hypothetical protein
MEGFHKFVTSFVATAETIQLQQYKLIDVNENAFHGFKSRTDIDVLFSPQTACPVDSDEICQGVFGFEL